MSTSRAIPSRLRPPLSDTEWLLRRIWDRVNRRNQHFMLCIVGQEGDGKSYTAMKMAHELDPTFTADRVLFDVSELLRVLRDREHEPGQFYVLDEAGVQLGRRTWQERGQILVNQALQLIRNHNLGLIFTLPRLGELDSQAQGRLQAFFEITKKEHDKFIRGKFKILDPDRTDRTGQIYHWFPRRRTNGTIRRITEIGAAPPSRELTEPYEERKREFQERIYESTLRELEGDAEDTKVDRKGPKDIVEEMKNGYDLENVVTYHGNTGEPYIDADLIEMEFGLSVRDAKKTKKLAEKDDDIDVSVFP